MVQFKEYPHGSNYLVDSVGNIYSKRFKKKLTPKMNWDGYRRIQIWKNQKNKYVSWHRVVAETWIPNPENKPFVNHKDGDKSNNHPSNLEWVTQAENIKHAWDTGLSNAETHSQLGPVVYLDPSDDVLGTYASVADASRCIGLDYWHMLYCAKKEQPLSNNHKLILLGENCNDYLFI